MEVRFELIGETGSVKERRSSVFLVHVNAVVTGYFEVVLVEGNAFLATDILCTFNLVSIIGNHVLSELLPTEPLYRENHREIGEIVVTVGVLSMAEDLVCNITFVNVSRCNEDEVLIRFGNIDILTILLKLEDDFAR